MIMIVIASGLMGISSLILRASVDTVGGFEGGVSDLIAGLFGLLQQPIFLLGVVLYGSGTLLWLRVLSSEPISIGYPILVSLAFLVVSAGAVVFFQEPLTTIKLVGMGVILLGVIILANG